MVNVINFVLEDDRFEVTVFGRHLRNRGSMYELLVPEAVRNEILDCNDLDVVFPAEFNQVRQPGHRPVVLHDLADHAGGMTPRKLC